MEQSPPPPFVTWPGSLPALFPCSASPRPAGGHKMERNSIEPIKWKCQTHARRQWGSATFTCCSRACPVARAGWRPDSCRCSRCSFNQLKKTRTRDNDCVPREFSLVVFRNFLSLSRGPISAAGSSGSRFVCLCKTVHRRASAAMISRTGRSQMSFLLLLSLLLFIGRIMIFFARTIEFSHSPPFASVAPLRALVGLPGSSWWWCCRWWLKVKLEWRDEICRHGVWRLLQCQLVVVQLATPVELGGIASEQEEQRRARVATSSSHSRGFAVRPGESKLVLLLPCSSLAALFSQCSLLFVGGQVARRWRVWIWPAGARAPRRTDQNGSSSSLDRQRVHANIVRRATCDFSAHILSPHAPPLVLLLPIGQSHRDRNAKEFGTSEREV